MTVELGQVVDGTVTGITEFGAFIQLPDGKTGLCHISEIADEYVKSVKDYLKEQQTVKVKVIEINKNGKVSLSIRKANENQGTKKEERTNTKQDFKEARPSFQSNPTPSRATPNFEDLLSKYLKESDEKLKDFKKSVNKRRSNGFNRRES